MQRLYFLLNFHALFGPCAGWLASGWSHGYQCRCFGREFILCRVQTTSGEQGITWGCHMIVTWQLSRCIHAKHQLTLSEHVGPGQTTDKGALKSLVLPQLLHSSALPRAASPLLASCRAPLALHAQVAEYLSQTPPILFLRPSRAPWRGGLLSMEAVIERLRQLLPATFEELPVEFAVGVVAADGKHQLIDSGPLAEAVVASAAIPFIFQSVDIPGKGLGFDSV